MRGQVIGSGAVAAVALSLATTVNAAIYRMSPAEGNVLAGATTTISVEVETEPGDNVVGTGYFSFAVDLTLTGTAGATGADISGILINEADFDDLFGHSAGSPQGNQYLNVAGVTTDFVAPTFGENPGDITWLFDFVLAVPASAELGDMITITPSEGARENVVANLGFDNVAPQGFEAATLTVVPEPTTALLLGLLTAAAARTHGRPLRRSRQSARP